MRVPVSNPSRNAYCRSQTFSFRAPEERRTATSASRGRSGTCTPPPPPALSSARSLRSGSFAPPLGPGDDGDVLSARGRVMVMARIRPLGGRADRGGPGRAVRSSPDAPRSVEAEAAGGRTRAFSFDHVFDEGSTQQDVFDLVGRRFVKELFQGYNCCVFAYGQTGSGKTHSMFGDKSLFEQSPLPAMTDNNFGLVPRFLTALFAECAEREKATSGLECKLDISMMEIYNEKVYDLLGERSSQVAALVQAGLRELEPMRVEEDRERPGTWNARGLTRRPVSDLAQVMAVISDGNRFRRVSKMAKNDFSSRSHAIFTVTLQQNYAGATAVTLGDINCKVSIVDLAGSESLSEVDLDEQKRIRESHGIRTSLFTLAKCFQAAVKPGSLLPCRESSLTKLLADIFSGGSKALMLATVSPSTVNATQSISTLGYAQCAKRIKIKPKIQIVGGQMEVHELKKKIAKLEEEYSRAVDESAARDERVVALSNTNRTLMAQLSELSLLLDQYRQDGPEVRDAGAGSPIPPPDSEEAGAGASAPAPRVVSGGWDASRDFEAKLYQLMCKLGRQLVVSPGRSDGTRTPGISQEHRTPRGPGSHEPAEMGDAPRRVFAGHTASVYRCAFSGDGSLIASISRDRTLRVWNATNGQSVLTIEIRRAGWTLTCDFAPMGHLLATAGEDGRVRLWHVRTQQLHGVLSGHTKEVYCCKFAPSSRLLVSGGCDRTVNVWDVERQSKLESLAGHEGTVFGVDFSPNANRIVSASDDKTLRVWRWLDKEVTHVLRGHRSAVWSGRFDNSGRTIVSAGADSTVRVWDAATGALVRNLVGHTDCVHHAVFSGAGQFGPYIVSCGRDRTLRLWNAATGQCLRAIEAHSDCVYHCATSGHLAVTCSGDKELKLWELELR